MQLNSSLTSFVKKLGILFLLLVCLCTLTIFSPWPLKLVPQILIGALFAHSMQLQHEAVHLKHFAGRRKKIVGFLLGLPMLISFTRYTTTHGYHHRMIGTSEDEESFNYNFDQLNSPLGLAVYLSMVSHYWGVVKSIIDALRKDIDSLKIRMGKAGKVAPPDIMKQIRNEYWAMAGVVIAAVTVSVSLHTTMFIQLWLVPLIFAGPVHVLIELPEHWQCNHESTNIFENTRSISGSPFMDWLTNGNCWHVEHHYKPSLEFDQLAVLHQEIKGKIQTLNSSYAEFYREFLGNMKNPAQPAQQ